MIDHHQSGKFTIPILYLDNHLLAVVKPPNMPVQADRSGDEDLLTALKRYVGAVYAKPGEVYLGLVHRLDRPVGGVMVFARTSKAAARLAEAFSGQRVDKRYLAVVRGILTESAEYRDYLRKDGETGHVRVVPQGTPGAKLALLTSAPIASIGDTTLTAVALRTGRAHQIRVQHAHAGHPLWGDNRYGGGRPGEQIALWAWKLIVPHPTRGEEMIFSALPPFTQVWGEYRDMIEKLDAKEHPDD